MQPVPAREGREQRIGEGLRAGDAGIRIRGDARYVLTQRDAGRLKLTVAVGSGVVAKIVK